MKGQNSFRLFSTRNERKKESGSFKHFQLSPNSSLVRDWQQQNQQLFNFPLNSNQNDKLINSQKDNKDAQLFQKTSFGQDGIQDEQLFCNVNISANTRNKLGSFGMSKRSNVGTVNLETGANPHQSDLHTVKVSRTES